MYAGDDLRFFDRDYDVLKAEAARDRSKYHRADGRRGRLAGSMLDVSEFLPSIQTRTKQVKFSTKVARTKIYSKVPAGRG